jgi:hypothetical protein
MAARNLKSLRRLRLRIHLRPLIRIFYGSIGIRTASSDKTYFAYERVILLQTNNRSQIKWAETKDPAH